MRDTQVENDDVLFQIHLLSSGRNRHQIIVRIRQKLQITPETARSIVDSERPIIFTDYRPQVESFANELRALGAMVEITSKRD